MVYITSTIRFLAKTFNCGDVGFSDDECLYLHIYLVASLTQQAVVYDSSFKTLSVSVSLAF